EKGDGVLVQTGTNRTEGVVSADLDGEALRDLRENSQFRPRREMNLGSHGPVLAEMYAGGLTIEDLVERRATALPAPELEPDQLAVDDDVDSGADAEAADKSVDIEAEDVPLSVPEALSLTHRADGDDI
ncbi:hypothetical protein ACFLWA_11665, partial [Chloroflexota bacterium]